MEIIYLLIAISAVFLAAMVWAFFWAVRSRQFDDLDDPAQRIFDEGGNTEDAPRLPPSRSFHTPD